MNETSENYFVLRLEAIARICHEANAALCQAFGDNSQLHWQEAPQWQRDSAVAGVEFHIANPDASASASHDAWLAHKRAEGWTYGPVKDAEAKTHPCIVPFHDLPPEQQAKDFVFRSIVHSTRLIALDER